MMPCTAFQEFSFRKFKLGLVTQTTSFHSKINTSFPRGSQHVSHKSQKKQPTPLLRPLVFPDEWGASVGGAKVTLSSSQDTMKGRSEESPEL